MSKLHAILVAAAAAFAFGSPPAQASTFTFTGNCTLDCTGTADATLVLTGYMLGNNITKPNFVSLTYHSTFMSFSVTPAELSLIGGTFTPPPLPGAEPVSITWLVSGNMMTLQTFSDGTWCASTIQNCSDLGNNGVWAATPLPATLPLFATGIGALGLLGWRRKRKAQAVA